MGSCHAPFDQYTVAVRVYKLYFMTSAYMFKLDVGYWYGSMDD